MKNTALTEIHKQLGAKMVPFAGYLMPVQYGGVNTEHETVRKGLGVFDVSHMGEFYLRGDHALDLIQYISSNDASKLFIGKAQYSCLPNDRGGIVDDLIIYRLDEKEYLLVVNASNIEKDWNWIAKQNERFGVTMDNASDRTSLLAIQGPKVAEAMQSLTDISLSDMPFYTFEQGRFGGVDNVIVSATGYTGSGGFEIYFDNADAPAIWEKVMEAGADLGIRPIGLAARDTLRLEMGYCLYGNDIDNTTSPLEAGLGWVTKFTKDFVYAKELKKQKEAGVSRKLIGFKLLERGIPRQGYDIVNEEGTIVGRVTSGTMSPSLGIGIGLGYVTKEQADTGNYIFIQIRKNQVPAEVVRPPFYKKTT